ncbi:ester cyclase [Virgibacillus siamensis]|uniref:ester cyclase n=1 Tax=Virgibacillus siamensis TaxID=480071 RepID=UPI00158A71AB|nr:ester cyclase [Virgibacillus siamensis]
MASAEKEAIVRTWFDEVFTKGNLDAVDTVAAKDMVIYSQGRNESAVGTDGFKKWLEWYCDSFANRTWFTNDIIEEEDKIVARYTGYSTYKGGLLDIPSEDQKVTETGIIIFRIENGKIAEQWCEMSDLQVVQQLLGSEFLMAK